MSQLNAENSVSQYIFELLRKGTSRDAIESSLREKGHEEYFVKEIVKETMKAWNAKLRSTGLTLIVIGAVLCFFSCFITLFSSINDSTFSFVLYGFTTVGIIMIFAGFTKIF